MRNTFVNTLLRLTETNKNLYLITGDLGYGVLTKFWEQYPNQFINAGISEQNMTSVACGMALEGKTVFTYSIANFPTFRCLEQIRNDVCYHKANVKIVAVGAGFSYGALGMSHHATEDIGIMRAIPEMVVFTPCDFLEAEAVTKLAAQINGPCYIRLGKGGEKNIHKNSFEVKLGKSYKLRDGEDIAILAIGSIIDEAMQASEILKERGIKCSVYSFPCVKPIDKETILSVAGISKYIFTLEEHNKVGGFGSAVAEVLAESHINTILVRIGLNDIFSSEIGSQDYLRKYYELDKNSIVNKILLTLNN